jgi:hypothetical protein
MAQPSVPAADNPPMRWHHLAPGHGVLRLDRRAYDRGRNSCNVCVNEYGPSNALEKTEVELELVVFWGDGVEPTRAAWLWRGGLAAWVVVGQA